MNNARNSTVETKRGKARNDIFHNIHSSGYYRGADLDEEASRNAIAFWNRGLYARAFYSRSRNCGPALDWSILVESKIERFRMGVVRIREGSPEYELIRGYREQIEAIRLLCYRAFIDDPPQSKKRYLARAILEIMGVEFTAPNNTPDNSK